MKSYRKTMLVLTLLMSFTTFTIVARNKKPDSEFKNLKVYPQDISKQKLDKDMELFARSLNVKCGYCHVHEGETWDYASDKKHKKEEARDMMRMTKEINEKYFGADSTSKPSDLAMNCYTCHRGEEEPVIQWDTINIKRLEPAVNRWESYKQ
jgi:hypothetical protein